MPIKENGESHLVAGLDETLQQLSILVLGHRFRQHTLHQCRIGMRVSGHETHCFMRRGAFNDIVGAEPRKCSTFSFMRILRTKA